MRVKWKLLVYAGILCSCIFFIFLLLELRRHRLCMEGILVTSHLYDTSLMMYTSPKEKETGGQ